jgi:hypothetical protein
MKKLLFGLVFSAFASAAIAADDPVQQDLPATVVAANGWYLSVDGSWQNVNLPGYGLGFRQVASGPFTDAGPFQTFSPHIDGFVARGTVGYFLPSETSNTLFGADTRVEIGGLYGRASGTDTGTVVYTGGGIVTQTLDGAGANGGYVCSVGQICTTNSNLSSEYSNWQLDGKIAGDYRAGTILLTPSVAVFGGGVHTDQTLAQVVQIGAAATTPTYDASTSLRWTDVGARAGLNLKVDVSPRVTMGLSGWAGFAGRHASLRGTEVAVDPIIVGFIAGASTLSTDANATPFVANAEASVAFKWLPALIVRGFAGLNYDSKVPGIASSSFTGVVGGVTSRTPASISFHSEISYYAGGGITWTF